MAATTAPIASAINAAANPDGSGVASVGLTHSPQIDVVAGGVAAQLGLARVVTPISAGIMDLIVLDHNRLRALYECYTRLGAGMPAESRQLLGWEIIMAMSEHAAKEELVLYPVTRAVLGDQEADHCLQEHAQVKLLAAQLDTVVATNPDFDIALRGAVEAMLAHIAEEEGSLLPRLGVALTPASQLQLGLQFEAAKVRAPTRPHPESPNLPPFNETVLAAAKQVDTALDQARMPSVVPAVVALNSGMQGVTLSEAGGVACVGAGGGNARMQGGGAAHGNAEMGGSAAITAGGDAVAVTRDDVMHARGGQGVRAAEQPTGEGEAGKGFAAAPHGPMKDITAHEVDAAI